MDSRRWAKVGIAACGVALLGFATFGFVNATRAADAAASEAVERSIVRVVAWERFASRMGVTIVWTSDERNCGAIDGAEGGCFDHADPDRIYISPGMRDTTTTYVVLHELAHVAAWRDPRLPGGECAADALASVWGASLEPSGYDCNRNAETAPAKP